MKIIQCGRTIWNFQVWTEWSHHILKHNTIFWRTLIINNILVLPFSRTPEQCPSVVSLLSESYNPHVRYGAAMALGICCAGTGNKVRATKNHLWPRLFLLPPVTDTLLQTSHMQVDFLHMYTTSQLEYSTTLNSLTFLDIEFLFLLVQNR